MTPTAGEVVVISGVAVSGPERDAHTHNLHLTCLLAFGDAQ